LDGIVRHLDQDDAERATQSIGFTFDELMKTIWHNTFSHELLCGRMTCKEWWEHIHKLDYRLEGVSEDIIWDGVFEKSTYDIELMGYLKGIRNKFRLVILTNCDKESKVQILDDLGDDHPFDYVLSSSDLGIAKPEPEIFFKLLDRIGA
jgi:HAD superfamily hydrolase (TIGR01549 family)